MTRWVEGECGESRRMASSWRPPAEVLAKSTLAGKKGGGWILGEKVGYLRSIENPSRYEWKRGEGRIIRHKKSVLGKIVLITINS